MRADRFARYEATLRHLFKKSRLRALKCNAGADFASNDYLALASSPEMQAALSAAIERGVPVGAGGSRLLRGNHEEHEALEMEAAAFFGCQRMLYFSSGYAANYAVLSTLPQRGDLIVYDCLIHASAYAGMRASRAKIASVRHNDLQAVEDAIREWRLKGGAGVPWIVVESLYSMDGDRSPLSEFAEIADRHSGFLFIDEAHATGVYGKNGAGLASGLEGRDNVIILHTCGKALGAAGALVGANSVLCDFLINRASPFIYSTAPSPLQAAGVRHAIAILSTGPERQTKLHELIDYANGLFSERFGLPGSGTQILPYIVGDNGCAVRVADRVQSKGFDLRAIRPPTVPVGTARLRISITLNVDKPTIARMMDTLAETAKEEMLCARVS